MERLIEFISNHPFLFSLLIALLSLLIWNLYGSLLSGAQQLPANDVIYQMNHANAHVVDIRSQDEFTAGHIIGAQHIPEAEFSTHLPTLADYQEQPLIIYCQHGTASAAIIRLLKNKNFARVYVLKGGFLAWRQASLPLEKA